MMGKEGRADGMHPLFLELTGVRAIFPSLYGRYLLREAGQHSTKILPEALWCPLGVRAAL